jgi:hypothetical protein
MQLVGLVLFRVEVISPDSGESVLCSKRGILSHAARGKAGKQAHVAHALGVPTQVVEQPH